MSDSTKAHPPTDTDDTPTLSIEMPHGNLVQHIMENTKYNDPDFVAASIIAARYDDPHVPVDITSILSGGGMKN